jgi:hypothetical protein
VLDVYRLSCILILEIGKKMAGYSHVLAHTGSRFPHSQGFFMAAFQNSSLSRIPEPHGIYSKRLTAFRAYGVIKHQYFTTEDTVVCRQKPMMV